MSTGRFALDPSIKALLKDLGLSPTQVLRRARLPADLFGRGPVELPLEEYFRLWEALDAESGDPDLAVAIGRSISVEMFNPPIFAALCSPDLRTALHETLPAGGSSMTAVTRHLAVSNRTLQRQLKLEGTSFQEILATTRETLARHYLGNSTMRIAEIAYLLGYDDTNSFYRAFRTWTGTTPDALRTAAVARG